jgi:hypothetical protein
MSWKTIAKLLTVAAILGSPVQAIGEDAEADLGLVQGENNGADNASEINEAIQARDVRYPIIFGGGDYDIEETIGAGVTRSNYKLLGSGVGQDLVAADSFWTSSSQDGGAAGVRIFWNKRLTSGVYPLDRALIRTDATSVLVDGLDLRGSRRFIPSTGGTAPQLARVGEPTTWSATTIDTGSGGVSINVAAGTGTFTRATGSYVTDGFEPGDFVTFSGFANGGNNVTKVIASVTATAITVTSTSGLVNETGSGDERAIWAYPASSFVTHSDEVWRAGSSGTAGNLEPGVSGWTQAGYKGHIGVWHQSADFTDWSASVNYGINRIVAHNDQVWRANTDPSVGEEPGVATDWVAAPEYKVVNEQNGPLILPSLSFGDLDVGILAGPHSVPDIMEVNGAGSTPADENSSWGDTIQAGFLQFHRVPVCVWLRTIQSVSNQFKQLYGRVASAEDFADDEKGGNAILWAEFAGETVVDNIQGGNFRTLLRTGYQTGGPLTVNSFRFDGGSITHARLIDTSPAAYSTSGHGGAQGVFTVQNGSVGLSNLTNAMDTASGDPIPTWSNSSAYADDAIVYWDGSAWEANANTSAGEQPGVSGKWDSYATWSREPIVHCGPGLYILRNVNALGSAATKVRLTGVTSGANNWASIVIIEDSFLSSSISHPDQIIDSASTGPYILIWKNCGRRFGSGQNNRIEMFRDGHHVASGYDSLLLDADSTPAPPPWDFTP